MYHFRLCFQRAIFLKTTNSYILTADCRPKRGKNNSNRQFRPENIIFNIIPKKRQKIAKPKLISSQNTPNGASIFSTLRNVESSHVLRFSTFPNSITFNNKYGGIKCPAHSDKVIFVTNDSLSLLDGSTVDDRDCVSPVIRYLLVGRCVKIAWFIFVFEINKIQLSVKLCSCFGFFLFCLKSYMTQL